MSTTVIETSMMLMLFLIGRYQHFESTMILQHVSSSLSVNVVHLTL